MTDTPAGGSDYLARRRRSLDEARADLVRQRDAMAPDDPRRARWQRCIDALAAELAARGTRSTAI